VLAAVIGGGAGIAGGLWLAEEALRVEGVISLSSLALPAALGLVAALSAGFAAGVIALPRRRLVAQLAS
jgi:putative ABC transport system permease protein